MRPQTDLRAGRARVALTGALAIGICTAAATPLVADEARAQSQPAMRVADPSIRYGQAAVVRGSVGAQNAGRQVALEYGSDRRGWRVIRTAVAGADGRYAFSTRLRRTGELRVALGEASALSAGQPPPATAAARSASRRVTVAARVHAPYRRLDVAAGERAVVRGSVAPWRAGRLVRLELLRGGRWRIVASDRTDARGRYALADRAGFVGGRYARVTFRGDVANARAQRRIGRVYGYRAALASRYDMYGGPLACGGRLGYHALVVAHKTLPCGTRVRVRYRGRSVTATVRDRGPYVGGREYDLAGAVARRLGFNGVGTIWVTR